MNTKTTNKKKMVDINSLMKVSNYGKMKDFSTSYIYKLAKIGKAKMIEIDGIKFIKIK